MRLLFLTNVFPNPLQPTKGVFNLELARALAQDHEVRVISPVSWVDEWRAQGHKPRRQLERSGSLGGVEVCYPRYYYPPKMFRRLYGWFLWRSLASTVRNLLACYSPDAVVGYWAHPDGEVAVRIARRIGAPAVVMVGGSDVLLLTRENGRRHCVLKVLHDADAMIAVSEDLKAQLVGLGMPPDKVHVVHRGVRADLFSPGDRQQARRRLGMPEEAAVLLWVGRMVSVKGLDVLLEACSTLRRREVSFRLYLVGDGPLRGALEADSVRRGLSDAVSFVGPRSHEELPDWYRAADLTVLPSRSEGVPNVLRESLACGTPFVASRVGGIPEIANGRSGRLVPQGDPAALAEAIHEALSDETTAPTEGCPAGWPESAESLLRVLRPLVSSSRRTALAPRRSWRQLVRDGMAAILPRRMFMTHGPSGSGSVCLTFDDGPDPEHTPRLLDRLKEQGIAATFFVVGQQAARHPDLVRRMAAEGHLVGHHSFFHSEPRLTSAWQLSVEVRQSLDLLARLLGKPPTMFRPPKGELTVSKLWRLWRAGQTVVMWNKDSKDYACRSSKDVLAWFRDRPLRGGDLVLMHDNRPHANEVLPGLLADARNRGLSFTTPAQWMT